MNAHSVRLRRFPDYLPLMVLGFATLPVVLVSAALPEPARPFLLGGVCLAAVVWLLDRRRRRSAAVEIHAEELFFQTFDGKRTRAIAIDPLRYEYRNTRTSGAGPCLRLRLEDGEAVVVGTSEADRVWAEPLETLDKPDYLVSSKEWPVLVRAGGLQDRLASDGAPPMTF